MIIEVGKKYIVHSVALRDKYKTDEPIISIEGKWIAIGRPYTPLLDTQTIGALWSVMRMLSDKLTMEQIEDNDNIWYGHIHGLGEAVHTSELVEINDV
jgi:hypothetical protein